jgi:DNA-binding NarL/FixJ family response regulator
MTPPGSARVSVLVVDDQDLVRGGLVAILRASGVDVVGEAADGPQAVQLTAELHPDVVLMDIEMPGGDGLTATRDILAVHPDVRVLVLTTFDLDEYIYQALRLGASGFLLKTTAPARLADAVRACAAGEPLLSPAVTRQLIETYLSRPREATVDDRRLNSLSPRELDVLRAMARGRTNAEIGSTLHLSEATVKTHITHIFAKLGLRDRAQAVVLAYEAGLVVPGGNARN